MSKTYINVSGQNVEATTQKPSSRTFRAAWQLEGDVITVDMAKARDIYRETLRTERTPLLADLDAQFMKALEQGVDHTAIAAEKQRLRDVTSDPAIDAAATPEALEALSLV